LDTSTTQTQTPTRTSTKPTHRAIAAYRERLIAYDERAIAHVKGESDPNRSDDEQYIVRLVGQVIPASIETARSVAGLEG
jgi:hypothetical protein